MSVNIPANTLRTIYNNSFRKYLQHSETIGGHIFEQSLIVNRVFQTTLELVQNFHNYKKPLNPLAEQYLTDPLFQEIENVKLFETKASDNIFQITLISKSIRIFEWVRENDVEKFVSKLNKYVQFYQQQANVEIEALGKINFEWLRSWNETYEEFSIFIVNFFKNGTAWSGQVSIPIALHLGDSHMTQKSIEHQSLMSELNKCGNIQRVLNYTPNDVQEVTMSQVFTKKDQKWLIQHQKDTHKGLVINTARKEDAISIYNCEDCTIVIENLINEIKIDLCRKVTVLFLNAHNIDIVDCKECNLHCFNKITELNMVSCEGCELYLSDKSLNAKISTTKCYGIIIHFPFEDGVYKSFPISDQLLTKIVPNRGIETTINCKV